MSVRTDFPPGQGCRSDDLHYEGESISVIAGPRNQPSSEIADGLRGFVCAYLQGHARRLYASVTDRAQVAAALLAAQLTHGRLPSPFTARDVYRNEWTGLTEPRVVQDALACLEECGWLRSDAVRTPSGGRPTVRFRINPGLLAGRHDRSRHGPPEAFRRS
jgi:hypothetical protein